MSYYKLKVWYFKYRILIIKLKYISNKTMHLKFISFIVFELKCQLQKGILNGNIVESMLIKNIWNKKAI